MPPLVLFEKNCEIRLNHEARWQLYRSDWSGDVNFYCRVRVPTYNRPLHHENTIMVQSLRNMNIITLLCVESNAILD